MLLQKLSFCMKDTYIIQGKDQFSLMKYIFRNLKWLIPNLLNSNIWFCKLSEIKPFLFSNCFYSWQQFFMSFWMITWAIVHLRNNIIRGIVFCIDKGFWNSMECSIWHYSKNLLWPVNQIHHLLWNLQIYVLDRERILKDDVQSSSPCFVLKIFYFARNSSFGNHRYVRLSTDSVNIFKYAIIVNSPNKWYLSLNTSHNKYWKYAYWVFLARTNICIILVKNCIDLERIRLLTKHTT